MGVTAVGTVTKARQRFRSRVVAVESRRVWLSVLPSGENGRVVE